MNIVALKNGFIKVLDLTSICWGTTAPFLSMDIISKPLESVLTPVFYVVSWLIATAFAIVRIMIKIEEWRSKKIANYASEMETKAMPDILKEIREKTLKDTHLTMKEKEVVEKVLNELNEK